tara:strand:- start:10230 stop:10331 length:102 start_codon:yes stop_codon:yes gene_type:complete
MITNLLLAGILLTLIFIAVMIYAIGEKISEKKQ